MSETNHKSYNLIPKRHEVSVSMKLSYWSVVDDTADVQSEFPCTGIVVTHRLMDWKRSLLVLGGLLLTALATLFYFDRFGIGSYLTSGTIVQLE